MSTTVRNASDRTSSAKKAGSVPRRKRKTADPSPLTPICRFPAVGQRPLAAHLHPTRVRQFRAFEKMWLNGTTLHYYFFNRNGDGPGGGWVGSAPQKAIVRRALCEWKDIGIGLDFHEVSNREEAEIRIGFMTGDGTWSFIGTDAIDVASDPDERTMNFDGDLTTKAGWRDALIEIGHALGFDRASQEPASAPDWNTTIESAQRVYPPMKSLVETDLKPFESKPLRLSPGQQLDVRIRPQLSRAYTIQTIGQCDVSMVLFEEVGGLDLFEEMDRELEFVAGDDDGGEDRNASLRARLYRDREYILRIRLYYSNMKNGAAILYW